MALSALDPKTALTIIDLQKVIVSLPLVHPAESTARQAYENSFHVKLAVDAMTDTSMESHNYGFNKVFPRLGETGSTQEILNLAEQRAGLNSRDLLRVHF